ncbi:MAG: hypothetical protein ACRDZM_02090, partial [Acidimicrobiia bacterium]
HPAVRLNHTRKSRVTRPVIHPIHFDATRYLCTRRARHGLEPLSMLAGTVFTTWDIVLILLIYVGLPLLALIALIIGLVKFVRRGGR